MSAAELLGRPRYVVRYWPSGEPGKGHVVRDETLAGKPPALGENRVLGKLLTYARQSDGQPSRYLAGPWVKDVVVERSDTTGTRVWYEGC